MALHTRLTELLRIEHPIMSAPMALTAGGKLASAITSAGGLGLIGGGYGDANWLTREFSEAGKTRVGCGFITWSLANHPKLLDLALAHSPVAVMLSFGAAAPFVPQIKAAGALVMCQVQNMELAREAVALGADIIIAQGAEAGGHGMVRATMTLVPEVADYLAGAAPTTVLVAAGGIADGRGLAAALMLGADGVLIGSRFLASAEALVDPASRDAAISVDGDSTRRTDEVDIARNTGWPSAFTGRVVTTRSPTEGSGGELAVAEPDDVADCQPHGGAAAVHPDDAEDAGASVGEAVGLIHEVSPAGDLLRAIAADAERLLCEKGPGLARG